MSLEKNINSLCHCKSSLLFSKKTNVIMMDPCEHLIHTICFKNLNSKYCPYCNTKIESIIKLNDYKKDPKLYQKCVDILTVTNTNNMLKISYKNFIFNLHKLLTSGVECSLYKGYKKGHKIASDFLKNANIKIKVSGLAKIQDGCKVFISNHTSYLDFLIIFYVLKTGFAAGSFIKHNILTKKLIDIVPTFIIDKSKSTNAVKGMKTYVEKHKSICIFPEGTITHGATIAKFRTGAFHIGYPIYAIILKYKNYMVDTSMLNFILKTHSENIEYVDFTIIGPFYPPFTDQKIELIRLKMADVGNLLVSRVSNRDEIGKIR